MSLQLMLNVVHVYGAKCAFDVFETHAEYILN